MEHMEKYALWLANVPGFGSRMRRCLFPALACAKEVYEQDKNQLEKMPGLKPEDIGRLLEAKKTWDVDSAWEQLAARKTGFVSIEHADYPSKLRQLYDAPYALFYRGRLPENGQRSVAIVGARMCSEYGRSVAGELAKGLAQAGVAVISGMARGVDAAGHRGALAGGGDTYAVFGCGVDVCYPNYHRQLYYEIAAHGGLLSEYLPGTPPIPGYFPQRNRLISALCDAVIIIEAKEKSGSLITADFALEQGRDVYALPGRITDVLSAGCNRLIAQGAGVIVSVADALSQLACGGVSWHDFTKTEKKTLEKDEMLVYSCLGLLPVGIEQILAQTGLDIRTVSRALATLQQKNCIEESFKNHYKTTTESVKE